MDLAFWAVSGSGSSWLYLPGLWSQKAQVLVLPRTLPTGQM